MSNTTFYKAKSLGLVKSKSSATTKASRQGIENTLNKTNSLNREELETFLIENNIESFLYKNSCESGDVIIIFGRISSKSLALKYIDITIANSIAKLKLDDLKSTFLFKKENRWNKSELTIPIKYMNGICPDTSSSITDKEINHITEIVKDHIQFTTLKGPEKQFESLSKEIKKQLNNPFYDDVNLCVRLTVANTAKRRTRNKSIIAKPLDGNSNQTIGIPYTEVSGNSKALATTFKKNDKPCEIGLDIKVDENGKLSINHFVNPDYLKEFEEKWEKEIRRRGLQDEIDIKELREQVLKDFESAETEHNFLERFVQDTKAFFSSEVGGYIEAIQATQKVAKHVWKEGTISRGVWHSTGDDAKEHQNFPDYMHVNGYVGGAIDGVVDEIAGIPMAIKGVYDIVTDEKQRDALAKVFTKEGFGQLVEGLSSQAQKIQGDPERLQHFSGQTTVSVVSMAVPGVAFTKIGKLEEVIDKTSDVLKELTNPKVLEVLEKLKKSKEGTKNIRHTALYKKIEAFLKTIDVKTLDKLADAPGFGTVIKDMGKHWKSFWGGKFVLEYASIQVRNGKVLKFEVNDLSNDLRRIYDVVIDEGNDIIKKLELKSWKGFYPESIKKQFTKDLAKMSKLEDGFNIQWVFNKKGVTQSLSELKENVLKALRKADGTPIDELSVVSIDQVKKIFPEPEDISALESFLDFGGTHQQFLLDKLNEDAIFDSIFEIVEIVD
ncbi:hypothetical protein [uncultured Psychroserpens sp.]|uniref:hypothetical protein n=1 Tax=uncultured Psychroserpens sp. TaxID=255436 RepID=UPI00261D3223|nr:hypothetical protein [uncultured Psychroserpens sp.]